MRGWGPFRKRSMMSGDNRKPVTQFASSSAHPLGMPYERSSSRLACSLFCYHLLVVKESGSRSSINSSWMRLGELLAVFAPFELVANPGSDNEHSPSHIGPDGLCRGDALIADVEESANQRSSPSVAGGRGFARGVRYVVVVRGWMAFLHPERIEFTTRALGSYALDGSSSSVASHSTSRPCRP